MPQDNSLQPWKPGELLDHRKLNAAQSRAITEIRVGPGMRVRREGNAVAISRVNQQSTTSARVVKVKLTSNLSGGGKYGGKIVTGSIKPTATQEAWEAADLAFPEDGLELPQDEDCYVINWAESGESGHSLTQSSASRRTHLCWLAGTAPDGTPIYETYAHGVLDCFE